MIYPCKTKVELDETDFKDEDSGKGEGKPIKAGDSLIMKAGENLKVRVNKDGSITYATKDEVDFDKVTLSKDNAYEVNLVNGAAIATEASVNPDDKKPTTSLNITSKDDKPIQFNWRWFVLNLKEHEAKCNNC